MLEGRKRGLGRQGGRTVWHGLASLLAVSLELPLQPGHNATRRSHTRHVSFHTAMGGRRESGQNEQADDGVPDPDELSRLLRMVKRDRTLTHGRGSLLVRELELGALVGGFACCLCLRSDTREGSMSGASWGWRKARGTCQAVGSATNPRAT